MFSRWQVGACVVALSVVGLCACSPDRMPPGDWTGRCATDKTPRSRSLFGKTKSAERTSWVTDPAHLLDAQSVSELTRTLVSFHSETCHQLIVVTVASLEGQSIEDYSRALANDLDLGYERFNNGLMLLIALKERKARIEVGCGLEDVVSDAAAAEVMNKQLTPAFRASDFAGGIRAAVGALMDLARRKSIPASYRPAGCR